MDKDEWSFSRMLRWLEGRPFHSLEKNCKITFETNLCRAREALNTLHTPENCGKSPFDMKIVRGAELNIEHVVAIVFIY